MGVQFSSTSSTRVKMKCIVALAVLVAAVAAEPGYGYGGYGGYRGYGGYGYGGYRGGYGYGGYGYGKRSADAEAEPGYGYRSYGYGGYGGYRGYGGYGYGGYGYGKRSAEAEPGYGYGGYRGGYGGYGYGKREADAEPGYGYRSYGYGGMEAEAFLLNTPYAGTLGYAGLPYAYPYAAYPIHVPSLVAYPNGAVTPADEPAVQAAKADHFAAKAAAYAAAPVAIAPAAHILHKRQAVGALALVGAGAIGFGLGGLKATSYRRRGYGYYKRSAEPGYGYRSYGMAGGTA